MSEAFVLGEAEPNAVLPTLDTTATANTTTPTASARRENQIDGRNRATEFERKAGLVSDAKGTGAVTAAFTSTGPVVGTEDASSIGSEGAGAAVADAAVICTMSAAT